MNKFIKDRKTLSLVLCLVLVCVFTLTVAYSALSAVLTIQGNARVSAADWDIYLNNPRVTSGSATTNLPEIKTSSTLEFETTLNMPGDFYEFVVDVVNAGDIDAVIENVVKTPELTAEQAKFLKYEVSYQNGESITTKQLLAKDTTMPIKVRIEYRKDLVVSDLPTGQVVLDLALTLEYTQSDGTGSLVTNNGMIKPVANGDINEIGTIVTIGSEKFYTFSIEGNNVEMLAMYNLHIGNEVSYYDIYETRVHPIDNPTGVQNDKALGVQMVNFQPSNFPWIGTTSFSSNEVKGQKYSDYNGSLVEKYVKDYELKIREMGVTVIDARVLSKDEIVNIFGCEEENHTCKNSPYSWIYATSYWIGTADDAEKVFRIHSSSSFTSYPYYYDYYFGVRPVIVISKDYFN